MAASLSILIPARNEMFLARTIEDILANIEADTEIIVVLDGKWAEPAIPQNDRVNVVFLPESVGQRAATNIACKLSRAKYVMKVDAHCAFDKGFDRKMLEAFITTGDNVTMVPVMRNLWAFDWKCLKCGKKWYQGPTPEQCQEENYKGTGVRCDSTKFVRKMMWIGKHNPQSTSYCFDSTPHFQYFEDFKHREPYITDKKEKGFTETMSLQGSAWMLTREKYWELNICDEAFGSWGSQGIEVAVKTWLSGGRVLVNHNTWYAHMFRTQGGDFSFPYKITNSDQKKAQAYAKDLFFGNKWERQIYPLSWLVEKFWPVKGWTDSDLENLKQNTFEFTINENLEKTDEIEPLTTVARDNVPEVSITDPIHEIKTQEPTILDTDGTESEKPAEHVSEENQTNNHISKSIIFYGEDNIETQTLIANKNSLTKISLSQNIPIINISSSDDHFGSKTIGDLGLRSGDGYYSFLRKIITALEVSDSEIVYFCQNNTLYNPTHFEFIPKRRLAFYYNVNLIDTNNNLINTKTLACLVAYRSTLIKHFEKRLEKIENIRYQALETGTKLTNNGIDEKMIYDPGMATKKQSLDNYKVRTFRSESPIIFFK